MYDIAFEAGRLAGLKQADSAMVWQTSCVGCARNAGFDEGFARGRRAGRREAARAIRERSFADHHPAGTHAGLLAKAARIAEGDEESGYSPVRAPDSPGGDQQP